MTTKLTRQFELRADAIIASRSKYKALEDQALKLVNYEITKSRISRSPLDIEGLKTYLNVRDIRYTQLYSVQTGSLIDKGNFFSIEVSNRLDSFQKKVAVMHEMAHIILEDKFANRINLGRANVKAFSKNIQPKVLEKICEAAAKEILLPKTILREELRGKNPSLKHLHLISEKYSCPLEFTASRILQVGLWQFRVLWWKITNDKPTCINSLPYMDELTLLQTSLLEEKKSLIMKSHLLNEYIEGMQKIIFNNVEDQYRVQVMPYKGDTTICMLVFP